MRRAGVVVLLVLNALAGLGGMSSVGAQTRPATTLRLASQTAWLADGGSFDLHLVVQGAPAEGSNLAVTIHPAVSSRSAFAQTLTGRVRGTTRQYTTPLADLPLDAHGNQTLSLPLPGSDTPPGAGVLPSLRPGVYPVTVALQTSNGQTLYRFVTHLVRLPSDPALVPLSVAWVQPIGTTPLLRAGGPRALTSAELTSLSTTIDAVDANPKVPMTLDVIPETLTALNDTETAPLRRAIDAGSQLLAAPYVDVDPSALVDAGRSDDLAVQGQAGEDALFTALGSRGEPRTWSAHHTMTPAGVARLREMGVTRLVLPESSLQPISPDVTDGRTLSRPFALAAGNDETVEAVAVDRGLTDHFRTGVDQVLAAHQLLADLAVLFLDLPGTSRGVVVRPPNSWHPSTAFLGTVLPALAEAPILHPVTLDSLFDTVTALEDNGAGVVRTLTTTPRLTGLPVSQLSAAHRSLDQLAALTGATSDTVASARRRILVGESSQLTGSEQTKLLSSVTDSQEEIQGRLHLPDGRTFHLTARAGTIPITLVNDNPFRVNVDLVLSSEKLEFTAADGPDRSRQVTHVVLDPGTETLTVPVKTRASATFSLQASILAPGGSEIARSRFTISSTAFSGVGIVLSIGAGAFLLLWWASNWRTVRRDRRLVDGPR